MLITPSAKTDTFLPCSFQVLRGVGETIAARSCLKVRLIAELLGLSHPAEFGCTYKFESRSFLHMLYISPCIGIKHVIEGKSLYRITFDTFR